MVDTISTIPSVPISMSWPDTKENKIIITKENHDLLHIQQNVPYKVLRRYREKTNHNLIPTDYDLDLKRDLYLRFFENAQVEVKKQVDSILLQVERYNHHNYWKEYHKLTINDAILALIEEQKLYIHKMIK